MRVKCSVTHDADLIDSDDGRREFDVYKVLIKCSRCGLETESYGDSKASINRSLLLLRQNCRRNESNFYVADRVYE